MRVRTPRLRVRVFVSALALAAVSSLASKTAFASVDCLGPSCGGSNSIMSGNVGIGSTSPLVSLDLSQKADALALPVGTNGGRPTGGNLANGEIRYNSSIPGLEAYVNGGWSNIMTSTVGTSAPEGSGTANYVARWTATTTLGTGTLYDNGSSVGIGTKSPGGLLTVYGALGASGQIQIQSSAGTGASSVGMLGFTDSAATRQAYLYKEAVSGDFVMANESSAGTSNKMRFLTNALTRMTIDSSGNVGIGTTSPGAALDFGSYTANLTMNANGSGGHKVGFIYTGNFQDVWGSNVYTNWQGTQRAALISGLGSVAGENTGGFMSVNGGTVVYGPNQGWSTTNPVRTTNLMIASGGTTNAALRVISGVTAPFSTAFNSSSGNEIFTIMNAGNVGIGTTAPGSQLTVLGNGASYINMGSTGSANYSGISLNNTLSSTVITHPSRVTHWFG